MRSHRCFSGHFRCLASAALVAGTLLCSAVLVAPRGARAQQPTPHVSLTYLADPIDNNGTQAVITKSFPVVNGIANGSINTDYQDDVSVANGSEFIVSPTVDPQVNLNETLFNKSGKDFFSLVYNLPDGLYFKRQELPLFNSTTFSDITLSDTFVFVDPTDPGNPDNGLTVFRTVTFAPLAQLGQKALPNGGSGNFNFTFHTPSATTPAASFRVDTLPATTAPEPGAAALLAAALAPAAAVTAAFRRRRRSGT